MRVVHLLAGLALVGCTASVATGLEGELEHGLRLFPESMPTVPVPPPPSGDYAGKFSTTSAVNSDKTFSAEYYGDLHFTIGANGKIECDWSLEGRMRDAVVGGVLRASSSVCLGRLQNDGTFEFRGAYLHALDGVSGEERPSFGMQGRVRPEHIEGTMLLGGPYASDGTADQGVTFFIVPVPASP